MDSIKEIILFAVNLIVCCAVLAMIAVLGNQTSQLAQIRTEEIVRTQTIADYNMDISNLIGQQITGAEVIGLMRDNTRTHAKVIWVKIANSNTWCMQERNIGNAVWSTSSLTENIRLDQIYTVSGTSNAAVPNGVTFSYA